MGAREFDQVLSKVDKVVHIQGSKRFCTLCSGEILQGQAVVYFPPAVMNEQDPCHSLNGSFIHLNCVEDSPNRDRIRGFIERERVAKSQRPYTCKVCHREIDSPDDFFSTFDLGIDGLEELTYSYFHQACFKQWELAIKFDSILKKLSVDPFWSSKSLELLRGKVAALLSGEN